MIYATFEVDKYSNTKFFAGVITAPNIKEARKVGKGFQLIGPFLDAVTAEQYAECVVSEQPTVCSLCQIVVMPEIDKAIEDGWFPDWWTKDDQQHGPVCPSCTQFLEQGQDGEMQLISALDC